MSQRKRWVVATTALTLLCGVSTVRAASATCPEGRTITGECVNPALAAGARRSAVMYAQSRLSATAFPVLPSLDPLYRYPNALLFDPQPPAPLGPFRLIQGTPEPVP